MSNTVSAWLTAEQAAQLLGVRRATLYAYVSRGWVRARKDRETRVYARADLETLRARSQARRGHAAVAGGALRFGEPVLDSSLTRIDVSGPVYRGHSAIDLALTDTPPESVAELLWTGSLPTAPLKAWPRPQSARYTSSLAARESLAPLIRALARQPVWPAQEPELELRRARRLLRRLASACASSAKESREACAAASLASCLCAAWGRGADASVQRALGRALVIVADHELNASAFAARVAAGAGADLPRCLLAGLATLSGGRHGGECAELERTFRALSRPEQALGWVRRHSEARAQIPGFGHPLYPQGDPRAEFLLRLAEQHADGPGLRAVCLARDTMALLNGDRPNLDLALVGLCLALELPAGSASLLFAVGRCIGYVAHVLEQRQQGHLLRPRARYIGV